MHEPKAASNGKLLLALLMLIYAINLLDRNILSIALPGIRAEFHLSDSALGVLTGPAFALVYVLMGIPLAVLTDRGYRRAVIAGSLAVFSVMTLLCGMASNFMQLLTARIGVGIGEAGSAPALNAVIAASIPPERRTGALSIYSAGANLGLLLAFFGGGLIIHHWGWRAGLIAAGVPGLLLMLIFLATWREPARQNDTRHLRLAETLRFLLQHKRLRFMALASGFTSIGGYATLAFVPSLLFRTYHLTTTQIGLLLAGVGGVIGFLGTMLPGLLSDRLGKGHDGLTVAVFGVAAWIPCHLLLCLTRDLRVMMVGMVPAAFFISSWLGPTLAAAQNIVPDQMRAQAAALLLAALNLVGMTAGPLLVGMMSDALSTSLGDDALRYALAGAAAPSLLAIACFVAARRQSGMDAT